MTSHITNANCKLEAFARIKGKPFRSIYSIFDTFLIGDIENNMYYQEWAVDICFVSHVDNIALFFGGPRELWDHMGVFIELINYKDYC